MPTGLNIFMRRDFVMPVVIMGLRGTSLVVKFILTLFIARYMGFATLGSYGLIAAASIIVPVFFGLSLMYTMSRKAVTQSLSDITHAVYFYMIYLVVVYAVLFLGAAVFGIGQDVFTPVILVMLVILFEHINNDLYNLFLNLSKPFTGNFLHFLRTAAWMIIFMALAFFDPSYRTLEALLAWWVIGGFTAFAGFLWVTRRWPWQRKLSIGALVKWIKEEFTQARTIYAYSLTMTVSQYFDRFLITFFLGLELTGVYVFFISATAAMTNLVRTGVIQFARPKMVRAYSESDPAYVAIYKNCKKHSLLVSLAMVIVAAPAMHVLVNYLDRSLAVEWFPIFILILASFLLTTWLECGRLVFYSQHRDDLILKLSLVFLPASVLSQVILISFMGLWGVAVSAILMGVFAVIAQRHLIGKLL